MSFSEQLHQMIQLPRQTYFCLQVNKVRARFTPLHFGRDYELGVFLCIVFRRELFCFPKYYNVSFCFLL